MGGVCAQLLTDIDPKIASQMGPRRRKNAEAKHVEIWHEVPAIADPKFFLWDKTKKRKKKKKAKQNSQNKQK